MKRILIVEDDRMILELLTELLSSEGHAVRAFASPVKALEFVRTEPRYDLIMLDLMMPEMDGVTFHRLVMRIPGWKNVPVILMSAAAQARDRMEEAQAVAYLPKPYDMDRIFEFVARHSL